MSQLTHEQRYTIAVLHKENYSQSAIAKRIDKDKSVVNRELKRNCNQKNGTYSAVLAQKKCSKRHSEKPKKICFTPEIRAYVEAKIREDHSPEQISGRAKAEGIPCVSHERIYQHIWADKSNKGELYSHLRNQGKHYRKRGAAKDKRGKITGRVGIECRPAVVEDKQRVGDCELDLIIGKDHKGALATINDRATGLLKMSKLNSKEATEIEKVVVESLQDWKPFLQTITSDNGKEFSKHHSIATALGIDYYFANPYCSWERGANENLNGLVRQYFPKGSDFNLITKERVKEVEDILNNRPRKRFGYLTPNEVYLQKLEQMEKVAFIT